MLSFRKKWKQTHEEIFDNTGLSVFLANLAPETLPTPFPSFLEESGGQVLKNNKVFYKDNTQSSEFVFEEAL